MKRICDKGLALCYVGTRSTRRSSGWRRSSAPTGADGWRPAPGAAGWTKVSRGERGRRESRGVAQGLGGAGGFRPRGVGREWLSGGSVGGRPPTAAPPRRPTEKEAEVYVPLWFEKKLDPLTGEMACVYKGGYWEAKERQDWHMCPNIF